MVGLSRARHLSTAAAPDVHTVVVGAGVVGLAIARHLARRLRAAGTAGDILLIEQDRAIGQGTSSRNSEVIHAGIYYPPGSLKAATCVEGRSLLYDFCQQRGVPHQHITKLIVATAPEQVLAMKVIMSCLLHDHAVYATYEVKAGLDDHRVPGLQAV